MPLWWTNMVELSLSKTFIAKNKPVGMFEHKIDPITTLEGLMKD